MRNDDAVPFIFICILGIAIIIGITIQVFFLLTLSRCLSAIRPRNREMEPGLVWLNLIPCVPIVFNFFIVLKIASSLKKEYRSRRWRTEGEGFGSGVGLTYAICSVIGLIPYAGALAAIPGFVCWIIYWVQIAGYKTKLESRSAKDLPEDDFDDDFDAPRRSSRRDEDEPDDRYRSDRPRRPRDEYDDDEPDDRIRAR
jgi:uncharacterized BrkB/YihY/UPF0761 family membrane protein